jgi:Fur family zinc uptake transcriptional regulator
VLELLCNAEKPMGAYDLADLISASGRRMAPITVYRTLEFLMELGLAHRLASQNAFIASFNGSRGEATAFLICEECGGVDEIVSPELAECLATMLKGKGFQPRARMLEVTGRCSHCRNSTRVFFGESDPARRSKVRSSQEERHLT